MVGFDHERVEVEDLVGVVSGFEAVRGGPALPLRDGNRMWPPVRPGIHIRLGYPLVAGSPAGR